jgi:hypothetical protein
LIRFQLKQLGEQQGFVALAAAPAQTNGSAEAVA